MTRPVSETSTSGQHMSAMCLSCVCFHTAVAATVAAAGLQVDTHTHMHTHTHLTCFFFYVLLLEGGVRCCQGDACSGAALCMLRHGNLSCTHLSKSRTDQPHCHSVHHAAPHATHHSSKAQKTGYWKATLLLHSATLDHCQLPQLGPRDTQ